MSVPDRKDALSVGDLVYLRCANAGGTDASEADRAAAAGVLQADGFHAFGLRHRPLAKSTLECCLYRICEAQNYRQGGGARVSMAPPGFVSPRSAEATGVSMDAAGSASADQDPDQGQGRAGPGWMDQHRVPLQFGQAVPGRFRFRQWPESVLRKAR